MSFTPPEAESAGFLLSHRRLARVPPPPRPQHVICGDWKTLLQQTPSVPAAVAEYLCDPFAGSLGDPLIFWEMTRRLWPRCVKCPLLYPSYMPWTIYLESEGVLAIQVTSQAVKEIYSEEDVSGVWPF